jgi:hypothetical protein
MSESGLPRTLGNTRASGWGWIGRSSRRRPQAGGGRGTRCSFRAFIRTPGTLQSAAERSNSRQVMPRTSPVRAEVKIEKRSAAAPIPSTLASAAQKAGSCCQGSAGRWATRWTRRGGGSSSDKRPRQRANALSVALSTPFVRYDRSATTLFFPPSASPAQSDGRCLC